MEPEEKAVEDGRIGSDTVLVDISSQCGTMNIGIERMEVCKNNRITQINCIGTEHMCPFMRKGIQCILIDLLY